MGHLKPSRAFWTFAVAFQDVIAIYSSTWEEHLEHVREVLQGILWAVFTIKTSKCHFGCNHIVNLGHVAGSTNIRPQEAKVVSVMEWPKPITKRDVQSFLGLSNFYWRFVKGFSNLAVPQQICEATLAEALCQGSWLLPELSSLFFNMALTIFKVRNGSTH